MGRFAAWQIVRMYLYKVIHGFTPHARSVWTARTPVLRICDG
jgi:hypothetical protein